MNEVSSARTDPAEVEWPSPPGAAAAQISALNALADRASEAFPRFASTLAAWREEGASLAVSAPQAGSAGEQAINDWSMTLRYRWLRHANGYASRIMRSPRHDRAYRLPMNKAKRMPYDRWSDADFLEARGARYHPPPPGWLCETILYSSGMAALSGVMHAFRARYGTRFGRALRLAEFGGYFEVRRLLRMLGDGSLATALHDDQEAFLGALRRDPFDAVFCQSVANTWRLDALDTTGLAAAWQATPHGTPRFLIVDTSLTGNAYPFDALLAALQGRPPALVARLSSGLKLDQQGLEFANAGILTLYAPARGQPESGFLARLATRMRRDRRTLGLGLNIDAQAALELPCFMDPADHEAYARTVFENNARFARRVRVGDGLLAAKAHPVLAADAPVWAAAPFVNFRLASGDPADKQLLKFVLRQLSRERRLMFHSGSSFGFRYHRFEMGIIDAPGEATFRIAIGHSKGPSLAGIVGLFDELGDYPGFDALRRAYPQAEVRARASLEAPAEGV